VSSSFSSEGFTQAKAKRKKAFKEEETPEILRNGIRGE
jgi:hypothetical protein